MFKNEKITNTRAIGRLFGYLLANELSKDAEPVYIYGVRIHHYVSLFAANFVDNEFLKGVLEGAGLHDLPDLLKDYQKVLKQQQQQEQFRKLLENLRRMNQDKDFKKTMMKRIRENIKKKRST